MTEACYLPTEGQCSHLVVVVSEVVSCSLIVPIAECFLDRLLFVDSIVDIVSEPKISDSYKS